MAPVRRKHRKVIARIGIVFLPLLASDASWAHPSDVADDPVQLAQKQGRSDVKPSDEKAKLRSFEGEVKRSDGSSIKIEITYLPIDRSLNLRLLTTADLPAAYARDATPLSAPEWLTASDALYVIGAGSFEDTSTGKRISQGYVKTNSRVRLRPRKFWTGIGATVRPAHFMDSVICTTTGTVESFFSAQWEEIGDWYGKTNKFPDCIQVGPMFVEKGSDTGFDKDAFDIGISEYQNNRVRQALWNSPGVQNLVFYCSRVDGPAVLGIAFRREKEMRMKLGDVGKVISNERNSSQLHCDRAIMLSHLAAGYFGPENEEPVGVDLGQSETLLPTVFAVFGRH